MSLHPANARAGFTAGAPNRGPFFLSLRSSILIAMPTKVLQTTALSRKGRGTDIEKKFEVIGALPNEEVLIEIGPRKKKQHIGFIRELLKSSQERIVPMCAHAPECGGCAFQHWDYKAQLRHKEGEIKKEFHILCDEDRPKLYPIVGCSDPWRYRNKMEFSFSENQKGEKFLGLMMAGYRSRVVDLKECFLVSPWFSEVVASVKTWWGKSGLHAYRHHLDFGHLRTLTLRESKQGRGKMVILTVSGRAEFGLKKSEIKEFIEAVKRISPEEHLSIFLQIHQMTKGRASQFFEMLLHGPDHITEKLAIEVENETRELEFKISPTSFFQPNTLQAQRFISLGLGLSRHIKGGKVLDLYCGAATLGLYAALTAKEVLGIELNRYSVFDAKWNQEVNHIENFSIKQGDVASVLEQMTPFHPDVVIVDPPRAGLGPKAVEQVLKLSPNEIVYVSCNPKTQAADISELKREGYQLKALQPVDQFPHTPHVENIAILERS